MGRIFIVKQRAEHTFWALPGGKLDPGETTLACVKRELFEETKEAASVSDGFAKKMVTKQTGKDIDTYS